MAQPTVPVEETDQDCVIPRPYESLSDEDAIWLRDQLEILTEHVSDMYADDFEAIPAELDGLNSAYIQLEMEVAMRGLADKDGE